MKVKWRTLVVFATVTVIVSAASILAANKIAILSQLERLTQDLRIATFQPNEPQDPNVVVVGITEETLKQFPYRSPVDRAFLAKLLTALDAKKPRAIGLDVLFDQPTEPAKDNALKETMAALKTPLLVSYSDSRIFVDAQQLAYLNAFLPHRLRARAEFSVDPVDGTVRWIFPGEKGADGTYLMGIARGLAAKAGIETPPVPQEMVWHGRPDSKTTPFKIFPAHLVPLLPPAWFKDKIVLIGEIVSLTDRHRTPYAVVYHGLRGQLSGIEIHANGVAQLLAGKHSQRLGLIAEIALVLIFAAIGAALGLLHRRLVFYIVLGGAVLVVFWGVGFVAYHYSGVMVPLLEPSVAFLLALWGTDAITGRQARRQREFIQSAFSRYLNPQLVKRLADDPTMLKLGGEMRDLTLMFSDIRSFTTISERFNAQELTHFVNRFMTPMSDAILAAGGTIDKYMGDAIMAFWNAPVDDPDHAEHACRAALAMRSELVRFNSGLKAEAEAAHQPFTPVRIGIGINTGECCVGNMGTPQRLNYSVLGDEVNVCSRLEGQSKTYGVDIVVNEPTVEECSGFAYLELDLILVKGKTRPVRIFTLVGDETVAANPAFVTLKTSHDALVAAYRAQQWAEARRLIHVCRAEAPELMTPFYALYEHRVREFEAAPPPPDWDGVYTATVK
ncbi:MAG TPA: adenylate/guanylate cyclase domain-containing protein [Stellaceae bacterium]|nr:adenylate/guanylate cyclase domain-containing protein [Stellaceae bacterium]